MKEELSYYAKAIIGFIAPGVVVIVAAVTETSDGGTLITMAEWVTAAAATVITFAGVAAIPNGPKPGTVPVGTGEHRAE